MVKKHCSCQCNSRATTNEQMSSNSLYQKLIERSRHFHRLAIVYPMCLSLKALHNQLTRNTNVSFKSIQQPTSRRPMGSNSTYQKPIERSSHFHRLVMIYQKCFSLCHKTRKALHNWCTRNAVVSLKQSHPTTNKLMSSNHSHQKQIEPSRHFYHLAIMYSMVFS